MKYCVAICDLFENVIKQHIVEAEDEYQAIKLGMLNNSGDSVEHEREWQEDENYPKDKESLEELLFNSDTLVSVIEII